MVTIGVGVKFEIHDLNIWFGSAHAIRHVNIEIQTNEILSVIGPANSGKTTFLRTLNRLNELYANYNITGEVELEREDIRSIEIGELRRKVGMVFALPLPLPLLRQGIQDPQRAPHSPFFLPALQPFSQLYNCFTAYKVFN